MTIPNQPFLRRVIAGVFVMNVLLPTFVFGLSGTYTWTDRSVAGSRNWRSIAGSSDGARLAAVVSSGDIYTSADYGATWVDRTAAGYHSWQGIASSADGSRLAAMIYGQNVYTSSDYGATWTTQTAAGTYNWRSITSSSDGSRIALAPDNANIYTSSDYGVTWTSQSGSGSRNWQAIAMSPDGVHVAAVVGSGDVYTSSDYGVTWTDRTAAGTRSWSAVAISSDGSRVAAAAYNGLVYTSSDYGATWTAQSNSGSRAWTSLVSSADGSRIVGTPYNSSSLYVSTDYGVTWMAQTGAGTGNWDGAVISSDGSFIAAAPYGGDIFTGAVDNPIVSLTAPASSATVAGSSVSLAATATDQGGTIAGVSFFIDNAFVTSDSSSPYSVVWDSTTIADGAHTAFAVASSTGGTYATSSSVSFTVHNVHTLSFDTQGGSTVSSQSVTGGASVALPAAPTRSGYTFARWNTSADNSGTAYAAAASYTMPTSDTTLYAIWTANPVVAATVTSDSSTLPWCSGPMAPGWNTSLPDGGCGRAPASVALTISPVAIPITVPLVSAATTSRALIRDLKIGMEGSDVRQLQAMLNANGFPIATQGAGSAGNETTYFGSATKRALITYQKAHDIVPASGYFGTLTRAQMTRSALTGVWW